MDRCIEDDEVAAYVEGALAPAQRLQVERHIDACPSCRVHVATLLRVGSSARPSPQPPLATDVLAPGTTVGRYRLEWQLGAGAMGVVWLARDPDLQRAVALKLPRHPILQAGASLREGRALARLSDPRIVEIYDIGEDARGSYIAMRYIEGSPLDRWAAARRPSRWREILGPCLDAGRGLAAAHRAGVLHRDVKPSNIMVGTGGDGFITDFGLSRVLAGPSLRESVDSAATQPGSSSRASTSRGNVGTPRYMAPEQHLGDPSEASDQYGFCAAVFEALHGHPPFDGEDAAALLAAKRRGPPARTGNDAVPAWLDAVLARGLAVQPQQRWPSMDGLLAALSRGPAPRRWLRALPVLGATAAVAFALRPEADRRPQARARRCALTREAMAATWNDDVRARSNAALAATATNLAVGGDRIVAWLDAHVRSWEQTHAELCAAEPSAVPWDDTSFERASWCLDEHVAVLAALTDELVRVDDRGVAALVEAAASLSRPASCADREHLAVRLDPPEEAQRGAVLALVERLFAARSSESAIARDIALAEAQAVASAAAELRWSPLLYAARGVEALHRVERLEYDQGEPIAIDAYYGAASVGDWSTATTAAIWLTRIVGVHRARYDDGLEWARHAEAALAKSGALQGLAAAQLARHVALIEQERGNLDASRQHYRRGLPLLERWLPPGHPLHESFVGEFATALAFAGEYDPARAMLRGTLDLDVDRLGEATPQRVFTLSNLGAVEFLAGRPSAAADAFERARALAEKEPGGQLAIAPILANLGALHVELGHFDRAIELLSRGIAANERVRGPDHPEIATSLTNLATVNTQIGDHARALALRERALVIAERSLPPESPGIAKILHGLASTHLALGDVALAGRQFERALAIDEKALGPDHPDTAVRRHGLGTWRLATGDVEGADGLFEQAAATLERTRGAHDRVLAHVLCDRARARVRMGDLELARALAERALAGRESVGPAQPDVARLLAQLASIHNERGDTLLARAYAERAVALFAQFERVLPAAPVAWFELARALERSDRRRARTLALAARDAWLARRGGVERDLARVDQWLRRHGGARGPAAAR